MAKHYNTVTQPKPTADLPICRPANLPTHSPARLYAFTLTELLTVIAIIAILMALLVTFYSPSQEQRKVFECQNRLQVLHRALRLYMLDWDGFPASPYDSLDNDKDGRFDEDPPDGLDNDNDGKGDEDGIDAQVGGLLALDPYLRSRRALICPADRSPNAQAMDPLYSSYQGCDTGTGFVTGVQICPQGIPTYAITRFLPGDDCHPSGRDDDNDGRVDEDPVEDLDNDANPLNDGDDDDDGRFDEDPPNILTQCTDPDKLRQLAVRNTSPYFPTPTFPADDTVITWCVHHRYIPNTTQPNYVKGGVPADLVLYFDGQVRIQQMPTTPDAAWRRKPEQP